LHVVAVLRRRGGVIDHGAAASTHGHGVLLHRGSPPQPHSTRAAVANDDKALGRAWVDGAIRLALLLAVQPTVALRVP
jgi:hypothetical protein